jgi:REP element-mobilizing transposase RayT
MQVRKKKSKNGQAKTLTNPLGSGRPQKKKRNYVPHIDRPIIKRVSAMHITVKVNKEAAGLRNKDISMALKRAIMRARVKGINIVHFSLQHDHIHLIVEGSNTKDFPLISRGMQSFGITFALQLNKVKGLKGTVYHDRYHLHVLKTMSEVKNAIHYVLMNGRKHSQVKNCFDEYSSQSLFTDWKKLIKADWKPVHEVSHSYLKIHQKKLAAFLGPPKTWAIQEGWKLTAGLAKR